MTCIYWQTPFLKNAWCIQRLRYWTKWYRWEHRLNDTLSIIAKWTNRDELIWGEACITLPGQSSGQCSWWKLVISSITFETRTNLFDQIIMQYFGPLVLFFNSNCLGGHLVSRMDLLCVCHAHIYWSITGEYPSQIPRSLVL